MYNITKSIDLTKEIGCGNFFKFIKDNLESLGEKEVLLVIVKGYVEKIHDRRVNKIYRTSSYRGVRG